MDGDGIARREKDRAHPISIKPGRLLQVFFDVLDWPHLETDVFVHQTKSAAVVGTTHRGLD
jgi:hypothetical protein